MKKIIKVLAQPNPKEKNLIGLVIVSAELIILIVALSFLKWIGVICMMAGGMVIWIIEGSFNRLKEKNVEDKR